MEKSPGSWQSVARLVCWVFILAIGVAKIMMHPDRMNGFGGVVTWLSVVTAPILIVSEIYRMRSR